MVHEPAGMNGSLRNGEVQVDKRQYGNCLNWGYGCKGLWYAPSLLLFNFSGAFHLNYLADLGHWGGEGPHCHGKQWGRIYDSFLPKTWFFMVTGTLHGRNSSLLSQEYLDAYVPFPSWAELRESCQGLSSPQASWKKWNFLLPDWSWKSSQQNSKKCLLPLKSTPKPEGIVYLQDNMEPKKP